MGAFVRKPSLVLAGLLTLQGGVVQSEGVKVEPGTRVMPTLSGRVISDSNFYSTSSDEESVTGLIVEPGAVMESNTLRSKLTLAAMGEAGFFDNGSQDNYFDSRIGGDYRYRASTRHRFSGSLYRSNDHDAFGLRRTEGSALRDRSLDEYRVNRAGVGYRFGAYTALINLELSANYVDREYTTNRDEGTRFLDYSATAVTGKTYFNISPKTSLILGATSRDIEYDNTQSGQPEREADERYVFLGAEWNATAKTTGTFSVGSLKREPKATSLEEFSGVAWEAGIEWQPRSTSTFTLDTSRKTDESFLLNSGFVDSRTVEIAWQQQWSVLASTRLGVGQRQQDFEDIGREDDVDFAVAGIDYRIGRNTDFFAHAKYMERDSTLDIRDYDKAVFQIGIKYQQ